MTIQKRKIAGGILSILVLMLLLPAVYVNANAALPSSSVEVSYKHEIETSTLSVMVVGGSSAEGYIKDGSTSIYNTGQIQEYQDLKVGTRKTFEVIAGSTYKLTGLSYSKDGSTYYSIFSHYDEATHKFWIDIEKDPVYLKVEFEKNDGDYKFEVSVSGAGVLLDTINQQEITEAGGKVSYEVPVGTKMRFQVQIPDGKVLKKLILRKIPDSARAVAFSSRALSALPENEVDLTQEVDENGYFWIYTSKERISLEAEFADATTGGGGSGESGSGGSGSGSGSSGGSGSGSSGTSGSGSGNNININIDNNNNSNSSSTSTSTSNATVSAKTGDTANTGLYLLLMIMATAVIVILLAAKKRQDGYKESE